MTAPYISNPRAFQHDTLILSEAVDLSFVAQAAPRHPVGLNVRQDVNYPDVLAFINRLGGVRSCLFHCDAGNLPRLHDFKAQVDILIWRPREHTGERLHEYITPQSYIDFARQALQNAGFAPGDVWIHLHNESGWNDTVIEWERAAAAYAISLGERVILLNPAVGNPHETQVHRARPLLKLAGEHPESIIIGLHEYFSVWGNRKYPYYIGRWQHDYQSQTAHSFESYRKSVKELKDKPVRYLATEWGADHLSDDEPYTNTLPTNDSETISGVHTLSAVWERDYNTALNPVKGQYPGLDTAFFEQLRVSWEIGQYSNPAMIGALIYDWGKEWPLFDISSMTRLHELLSQWRPEPLNPTPEVAEFNLPYDAVLQEGTNLRTLPTTDNKVSVVRITVKQDTLVTVREPVEPVLNNGYSWFQVTADVEEFPTPQTGWMAKHRPDLFQKVDSGETEPPPPKPDEPPTDPPPPVEPVYVTEEKHQADLDKLRTDLMEYHNAKMAAFVQLLTDMLDADGKAQVTKIELLGKQELAKAS